MVTNTKEYQKAYYESHKEKIQGLQRAYYKRRRAKKLANP